MRILSGKAKNKRLKSQKGHKVRPPLARIKESLFGILKPYIYDSLFLDLYSGTGSIALEALSQGAKRAVMIDQNNESIKVIIENVNNLGFQDKCRAYKNDALRAIEILGKKREEFDIVFMDPPYHDEVCEVTISKVIECNILKKNGLIVAEHHINEKLPNEILSLKKIDERKYSDKIISFYS